MAPASSAGSPSTSTRNGGASTIGSKHLVQKYLTNCKSLYSCIYCRTHLANHDELVSRSFQGNHGRAYLFNSVINISCGPAVQRELNTGSHAVADIFCANCEKTLGWKYEKAYVEAQKYKEGKYIIELAHVVRENRHLELDKGEIFFNRNKRNRSSSSSNGYNQGSLTPPSPSHWSSPTTSSSNEEVDEDDEELMFPFYDDLYASRSSYPSNLSSSHHNRMRRSLYLDSTPYDWKYSTTSSSSKSNANHQSAAIAPKVNLASSLGSSYSSSSPSTSSSSSPQSSASPSSLTSSSSPSSASSSGVEKSSYHISSNNNNNNNNINNHSGKLHRGFSETCDEEEETQFKFEADKPEFLNLIKSNHHSVLNDEQSCDHSASGTMNNVHASSQSIGRINIDLCNPPSSSGDTKSRDEEDNKQTSASSILNSSNEVSVGSTISLDDEQFYDCFTDHDVSKLVVNSDSNSTLKIAD